MRLRIKSLIFVQVLFLMSCAHTQSTGMRMTIGAAGGGVIGGVGGALLSPNDESRGMNAVVFGGVGAFVGGLIAYLTDRSKLDSKNEQALKESQGISSELSSSDGSKKYVVPQSEELPQFVKDRLAPVVIEEYLQKDQVNEDGSLSEPHKVYRIMRQAELIPSTDQKGKTNEN